MQFDLASISLGFLVGTFTGAAASYFGNKYTDRRRTIEAEDKAGQEFEKIAAQMPELVAAIKNMLQEKPIIREFVVTSGNRLYFTCAPNYVHECGQYEDLLAKVRILENAGYVRDVTASNAPKFAMTEEFVAYVTGRR